MILWLLAHGIYIVVMVFLMLQGIVNNIADLVSLEVVAAYIAVLAFLAFCIYCFMAVYSLFENIRDTSERSQDGLIMHVQTADSLISAEGPGKDFDYVKLV